MPTAPPRVCNRCRQPAPKGQPCQCRPAFEGSNHPFKTDNKMRKAMLAYKRKHPHCQVLGCPLPTHATDHIIPIAEGGDRYSWDNMQSLCRPHHDKKTNADALRGKTRAR